MTETEWMACDDPVPMLEFLRGKASDRKLRLFAVGCLRADELRRDDPEHRATVMQMEEEVDHLLCGSEEVPLLDDQNRMVGSVRLETAFFAARDVVPFAGRQRGNILRDIFGNPFQPVTADPRWLTSTVRDLATAIYAERAFDRLPILADALEDAGCDNADILSHCRGDGPHVRGCWVVDLILGKA